MTNQQLINKALSVIKSANLRTAGRARHKATINYAKLVSAELHKRGCYSSYLTFLIKSSKPRC